LYLFTKVLCFQIVLISIRYSYRCKKRQAILYACLGVNKTNISLSFSLNIILILHLLDISFSYAKKFKILL